MKPGMQRDILVVFQMLFDEFDIGNGDPPVADESRTERASTPGTDGEKGKPRANNHRTRRRS